MNRVVFEREILARAKIAVRNMDLTKADIIEWAIGEVQPRPGEVAVRLEEAGCSVAYRKAKTGGFGKCLLWGSRLSL